VQLQAAGGDGNYTFSGSPLTGMTLTASGVLSGTSPASCCAYASAPVTQTFGVRATDQSGHSGAQTITVTTSLRPTQDLTFTPTAFSCGVGMACTATLQIVGVNNGGGVLPFFALVSGHPPVNVLPMGDVGGIPQVVGTFPFRVRAIDRFGYWAEEDITLTVFDPSSLPPTFSLWLNMWPPVAGHPTSISCIAGQPCNWGIGWEPNTIGYKLTLVSGSLPPGFGMPPVSSLPIPQQPGSWTFRVHIVDTHTLAWGEQDLTIVVPPPSGP
jgi:hypothetical protein